MEKKGNNNQLFSDFPEISFERWYNQALKEAGSERALHSDSYEGIKIEPIYHQATGPSGFPSFNISSAWSYIEEVEVWDEKTANRQAIEALEGGADGVCFMLFKSDFDIKELLKGIWTDNCILVFGCPSGSLKSLNDLFTYHSATYDSAKTLHGWVKVLEGASGSEQGICTQEAIDGFREIFPLREKFENFHLIEISVDEYKNQGIDIIQELAYALSKGVEVTESLRNAGIPVKRIFRTVVFSLTVGMKFFFEISKLKVLRLLWTKIAGAYGMSISPAEVKIHCKTSLWNKSVFDKENNIIRNTAEAMAAVIGGCNHLTVYNPFPSKTNEKGDRRISRNISHILRDEVFLSRVADVSKGSYYVENLCLEMADKAWKAFLNIEKEGGFSEVSKQGRLGEAIAKAKIRKRQDLDFRRSLVIGTNVFPNLKEKTVEIENVENTQELRATGAIESLRIRVEKRYINKEHIRPVILIASEEILEKSLSNLLINVFQSIGFLVEMRTKASSWIDLEKTTKYPFIFFVMNNQDHYDQEKNRLQVLSKDRGIILTSSTQISTQNLPFFSLEALPLTETLEEVLTIIKKRTDAKA